MSLGKVPQIMFWFERVDRGSDRIWSGHAVRNWDLPSNGVFALFTHAEIHDTRQWHSVLRAKLEARERRLFSEFGHRWRHHLADYSEDDLHSASVDLLLEKP